MNGVFWHLKGVPCLEGDNKLTGFQRVPKLHPGVFLRVKVIILLVHVTGRYPHAVFLLVTLISFHYPVMRLNLSLY